MPIVLHPQTEHQIELFLMNPAHALLLEGEVGVGKGEIASLLSYQLLSLAPEKLIHYPYFRRLNSENNETISIETVRDIQKFLQLKTTGQSIIRRILVVENANLLTTEAQNAFLKMLEEPPADTVLLLTSSKPEQLLPTLRSRLQSIQVKVPPQQLTQEYFNKAVSQAELDRAYYISGGRPGLLQALLTEDKDHPLASQIEVAKQLLLDDSFKRLLLVDKLSKQKENVPQLLHALELVADAALHQASNKDQTRAIKSWHSKLSKIVETEDALRYNPNLKLLLTDLLLNL